MVQEWLGGPGSKVSVTNQDNERIGKYTSWFLKTKPGFHMVFVFGHDDSYFINCALCGDPNSDSRLFDCL